MKVEFFPKYSLGAGRALVVQYSEFKKYINEEEYFTLCFATEAFYNYYGISGYLYDFQCEKIMQHLKDKGFVIITIEQGYGCNGYIPAVYVSNNGNLQKLTLPIIPKGAAKILSENVE